MVMSVTRVTKGETRTIRAGYRGLTAPWRIKSRCSSEPRGFPRLWEKSRGRLPKRFSRADESGRVFAIAQRNALACPMLLRHLEEPAMIRIKRVLVPTDFSRMSELALSYALSLAARDGAALHLLHVVDDAVFAVAYADGLYVELPLLRSRAIEDGER